MMPDYKGGSIVNLMSSIIKSCGGNSEYASLRYLSPKDLKKYRNIVLLIIDGLGYDIIQKNPKSALYKYLSAKMTSVYPPTTAAAVTAFMTGLAPQNHGITGWYVHFKEFGSQVVPLPFRYRYGGPALCKVNRSASKIFDQKSMFDKITRPSYMIQGADIIDSDYTRAHAGKAKRLSYKPLSGMFKQLRKVLAVNKKKYAYAYWDGFDTICHIYGKNSREAKKHFKQIDRQFSSLIKSLKDTVLIVTADHGHSIATKASTLHVEDHPKLLDALSLPICGEPRTVYCYVHPAKAKQFESYVRSKLGYACELHTSEELVKKGLFGLFKPHPGLYDRVGDYVLLMKKNYVLLQGLFGKPAHEHIGNHGGMSKEELFVPLIVVKS